eukprot:13112-Heterococcus_DN1.PRE.3
MPVSSCVLTFAEWTLCIALGSECGCVSTTNHKNAALLEVPLSLLHSLPHADTRLVTVHSDKRSLHIRIVRTGCFTTLTLRAACGCALLTAVCTNAGLGQRMQALIHMYCQLKSDAYDSTVVGLPAGGTLDVTVRLVQQVAATAATQVAAEGFERFGAVLVQTLDAPPAADALAKR